MSEEDDTRRQLPRYTTIDLESDVPSMYNTSLNPHLNDPDLTIFYSRTRSTPDVIGKQQQHSPPPSYSSSVGSRSSVASPILTELEKANRRRLCAFVFFMALVFCPLAILILYTIVYNLVKPVPTFN